MACLVLNGRLESCYDSVGGIDAIYFVNRGTYVYPTDVTLTEDTITAITGITEIFKYELRGVNSFDQTQTPSSDNGTNFVAQALTVQLKQLTPAMHKNFKLIAYRYHPNRLKFLQKPKLAYKPMLRYQKLQLLNLGFF